MIQTAMTELTRMDPEKYIPCPLSVCVAMSQGYIGYDLQNALRETLLERGIPKAVSTVLTQVEVDPDDPAFLHPTKPIGAFMSREEAERLVAQRGYDVVEDAGRGYRRVVASPRPRAIVELETIRALVEAGQVVIACGGGGIPVVRAEENRWKGAAAVIDKDFAAELLAESLEADLLIILTAVEKVAIRFRAAWRDLAVGAEAGGGGAVHACRGICPGLHAAQGGGRRSVCPLCARPDGSHHRAAKGPSRHCRSNRHPSAGGAAVSAAGRQKHEARRKVRLSGDYGRLKGLLQNRLFRNFT